MTTITVTTGADSGAGSLRAALAGALAGDTINFAADVTEIDLASTLAITKNVTIEGSQPGSIGTPGVAIVGGAASSNFSDFTINAGVTATLDGLIIADGHATGAAGANGILGGEVAAGAAAGGIYDAGALTLSHSQLVGDTAVGGSGGAAVFYAHGGGAGGSAAGGIYVTSTGTLDLQSDTAFANAATGGQGGAGHASFEGAAGGAGGAGAISGQSTTGSPGAAGNAYSSFPGGAGGAPGQPGQPGGSLVGGGGGGGGGSASADVGGAGTINGTITDTTTLTVINSSDSATVFGSLRYELSIARPGDTINFAANVKVINLASTLAITKNITIEGSQPGSIGTAGVIINGGGASSNFSDFTIVAGVAATFDGLVITGGHATGAAGSGFGLQHMGAGGAAAGGIFDAGTLTLSNSALGGDTATGGSGGVALGNAYGGGYGGGAGGSAAGGIYVTSTGTLNLQSDTAFANVADGGQGGAGQVGLFGEVSGGAGGAGAISDRSIPASPGAAGAAYYGYAGGRGGAPGQPGQPGGNIFAGGFGGGGGGGGGFAFADVGGAGTIHGSIACYCPGTLIETRRGQKPVEKLEIGDKVMTVSGTLRPIKWIGRRSYGGRFVMGRKDILPVCIKAGALGDDLPRRDLWISPHHAMYLEGVLIEAKDLVNGASIVQTERADKVEYFHIELDSHDVIVAEGALSETFVDDDSRGMFHNAHEYSALYPDAGRAAPRYCATRCAQGYELEAARRRIDARAGLRPAVAEAPATLRGYVDVVDAGYVAGWAQNPDHPEAPVCLDIFAGDHLVGQVVANRFRDDLARAGIGSGRHSFRFALPDGVCVSANAVEVRRSFDKAVLPVSGQATRRAASA